MCTSDSCPRLRTPSCHSSFGKTWPQEGSQVATVSDQPLMKDMVQDSITEKTVAQFVTRDQLVAKQSKNQLARIEQLEKQEVRRYREGDSNHKGRRINGDPPSGQLQKRRPLRLCKPLRPEPPLLLANTCAVARYLLGFDRLLHEPRENRMPFIPVLEIIVELFRAQEQLLATDLSNTKLLPPKLRTAFVPVDKR